MTTCLPIAGMMGSLLKAKSDDHKRNEAICIQRETKLYCCMGVLSMRSMRGGLFPVVGQRMRGRHKGLKVEKQGMRDGGTQTNTTLEQHTVPHTGTQKPRA